MKNEEIFSKLSKHKKRMIEMYLTARQFKNAVPIEEMIVVPNIINGFPENTILDFNGSIRLTCKGNKVITKVFPFIVNKSFACEVYLKFILKMNGFKHNNIHNLYSLFNLLDKDLKNNIITCFMATINKHTFFTKLKRISNAFERWRYIYEHYDEVNTVEYTFLNMFCNVLDGICADLIMEKYKYDVSKNIM